MHEKHISRACFHINPYMGPLCSGLRLFSVDSSVHIDR